MRSSSSQLMDLYFIPDRFLERRTVKSLLFRRYGFGRLYFKKYGCIYKGNSLTRGEEMNRLEDIFGSPTSSSVFYRTPFTCQISTFLLCARSRELLPSSRFRLYLTAGRVPSEEKQVERIAGAVAARAPRQSVARSSAPHSRLQHCVAQRAVFYWSKRTYAKGLDFLMLSHGSRVISLS